MGGSAGRQALTFLVLVPTVFASLVVFPVGGAGAVLGDPLHSPGTPTTEASDSPPGNTLGTGPLTTDGRRPTITIVTTPAKEARSYDDYPREGDYQISATSGQKDQEDGEEKGGPSVSAAADPTEVTPGDTVEISGQATDPDNDRLTVTWEILQRPADADIGRDMPPEYTTPPGGGRFTVKLQPNVTGTYELKITVEDPNGHTDSTTVLFQVRYPDKDADGIRDDLDYCPEEPEDFDGVADSGGCPEDDADKDGFPDGKDNCPTNPEDTDGILDNDGCPGDDEDGDDNRDRVDTCPAEPEDDDGVDDLDGCPEGDGDDDGVDDIVDDCRSMAEDEDGVDDTDGCPEDDGDEDGTPDDQDPCPLGPEDGGPDPDDGCPDSDEDGIPDTPDECMEEAEDEDGIEDDDGCPEDDADGDGEYDNLEDCPEQPEDDDGVRDSDGCPGDDEDDDGVPDEQDECNIGFGDHIEDHDGHEDGDGCNDRDNDGDGIWDFKDDCPDEAEDVEGHQDDDGCPEQGPTRLPGQGVIDQLGESVWGVFDSISDLLRVF